MQKLLLHLAELDCGHLSAIGCELAIGLSFEVDELLLGGGGLERGEEFFFEHGEGAVEVVERGWGGAAHGCGEFAESDGGGGKCADPGIGSHLSRRWNRRRRWVTRDGGICDRCCLEGVGITVEVGGDALGFEAGFAGLARGGGSDAGGGFDHLLGGLHDRLRAPGEAVDLAQPAAGFAGAGIVLVEGGVDAAQDSFKRNAGLAPGLDQRPVERVKQQDRAAAAAEALFDLGEVFEVVHRGSG